jgi:hypothetical protein
VRCLPAEELREVAVLLHTPGATVENWARRGIPSEMKSGRRKALRPSEHRSDRCSARTTD